MKYKFYTFSGKVWEIRRLTRRNKEILEAIGLNSNKERLKPIVLAGYNKERLIAIGEY